LPAKYSVTGYPNLYLIGKGGKIANVVTGYTDSFEQEISSAIGRLLNET
jgi:hypothetical protein